MTAELDTLCIHTIRTLSMDAVQKANSGHPGAPMGCAPMAYTLWSRHLRFDPRRPDWANRDRFILSNGHASMLLYSLLHLTGFELPLEEIQSFRQLGSITPGHPENFLTPGVEMTTGPLGQGFAHGIGFALAEATLAAQLNREDHTPIDHHTYAIVSDGDLMEGVASEAASLAGHLGLGKLVYLFDDNHITIDGTTDIAFTEDVEKRFNAYGWHTLRVSDGNDVEAIDAAITAAKAVTDKPSLILVRTHIGYGSPNKQDSPKSHGSPLGEEEIRLTKAAYGWPEDAPAFHIPEAVRQHMSAVERGAAASTAWDSKLERFAAQHPEAYAELTRRLAGALPDGWDAALPTFETSAKGMATRAASGKVLAALHQTLPELIGGSADLAGSNKTLFVEYGVADRGAFGGRNIHFGVREHTMAAICNGIALHGGFLPFGATFLIFSDYMRPAVRLGALEHAKSVWVWTHDSIGLGEDGPTHQPIEQLPALRAIPGLVMLRPGDANEVREAWKIAVTEKRPVGLVLTRQNVPTLDRSTCAPASNLARGAYTLLDAPDGSPRVLLIATGSELSLAVDAHQKLADQGIPSRVVSMPSWRLFADQDADYRNAVLPPSVTARVAVEAGSTFGWERYVGNTGKVIGMNSFGASAPAPELYAHFGITVEAVVEAAKSLLD